MINLLIGPIADLAGTWLKGKVETQKAKTEMVVSERKMQAQINLKKSEADIDWDMIALENQRNSWRDEFLTILLSIPIVLCFIPGFEETVSKGFENMEKLPNWFQIAFLGSVASAFGLRGLQQFWGKKK